MISIINNLNKPVQVVFLGYALEDILFFILCQSILDIMFLKIVIIFIILLIIVFYDVFILPQKFR